MTQSCDLPIVRVGQAPTIESDCSKEAAARKIYAEVGPATVKISHDNAIGSGFFVGDGSRVVTNAHVVNGASELLTVETIDHKQFKARIEKIDDINDLAVIHLEDGARGQTSLKLGSSDRVKINETLYAMGHPLGKYDTYIAPGHFTAKGPFDQVFASKDPADVDWQLFLKTAKSPNPDLAADARGVIKSPRVEAELQIEGGNSGGPMVNEAGEVVGVSQFGSESKQFHKYAWAVPSEQVSALLVAPPKFQFDYEKVSSLRAHPFGEAFGTAITAGLSFGLPRVGGGLVGLVSAADIYLLAHDKGDQVKDSSDRLYRGLEWTSDIAFVAGATMAWVPRLRTVALASYGIGLAAGIGDAMVPHYTKLMDIKRTANPQDKRWPLYWDGMER